MFDKLNLFLKKYEELQTKLYDPALAADIDIYRETMKELSEIEPVVNKYKESTALTKEIAEEKEMLYDTSQSSEFKEMVRSELNKNEQLFDNITEELKIMLLPKDPNDHRNVIMEIRGGAGGEVGFAGAVVDLRRHGGVVEGDAVEEVPDEGRPGGAAEEGIRGGGAEVERGGG